MSSPSGSRCHVHAAGVAACFLVVGEAIAGSLNYVESSAGLATPTMEAGNTEFAFGDLNHGGHVGIAIGDVNGDGLLDVGYGVHHDYSATDLGDQLLEVALGDGSGVNWIPWDDGLATNGETWGMFGTDFADVDNDGDLDIGSISFGCCAGVHVYLNNGDGTWTQSFGFTGGNASQQFEFGDVNGDGNADIVTAHQNGTVWLGNGMGGFSLADAGLPGTTPRTALGVGDVDGDGRDDISFSSGGGIQAWSWSASGWQNRSGTLATIGAFNRTAIVDMDLDGHADVVVFKADLVRVYGGDGAGGWSLTSTISLPNGCDYVDMQSGVDFDHNGRRISWWRRRKTAARSRAA